jgi:HSP20 family molecular chaperone IbpA
MAFALAGYSPSYVSVGFKNNELYIDGVGSKIESIIGTAEGDNSDDEYPIKVPSLGVQHGMIVRGIARRSFKAKYFISPLFDLTLAKATMKDGLLEVTVPRKFETELVNINIKEI